jgi:5-methylcytosine-specific restriction endonuclease McrA
MPIPKDPGKARLWRERQKLAQVGKSKNKGADNPFYGKSHTEETRRKISAAITGKANPNFGKLRPQSVKDAVSKAHKGVSPAIKGKHLSDEAKRTISEKAKARIRSHGRRNTPAQRLNISNGTKLHALRGEDNPRWKGGISPENQRERYSFRMKEWRRQVFERDHFVCQQCGYNKGKILIAHHIKPFSKFPELRFDFNNGITLCKPCHQLIPSV